MTPEAPRPVTWAELEALEGRMIGRYHELETRLVRDINTAFWRQVLALGSIVLGLLAVIATVLFFALSNLYSQLGALQNAIDRIPH